MATASGAESLQPQPEHSAPAQESPALAAADKNLELGLDAPAKEEPDALDEADDDDWGEGEDLGDEDLEGDLSLGEEDDDDVDGQL